MNSAAKWQGPAGNRPRGG